MDCPALPDAAETLGDMSASQTIDEASDGLTDGTASSDEASNDTGDTSPGVLKRTRSRAWDHYARLPDFNGIKLVKCHYCVKQYVVSNGSTGNLWRHVKTAHPTRIDTQEPADEQVPVYTDDAFRDVLVEWIVVDDQPFSKVESRGHRKKIRLLNPRAKVPSARTLRRDIRKRFKREKARVCGVLHGVPGRLSFAVDAWTSPNMHAFLGITVHWIDAEWQPRHVLLDVPPLLGRHEGANLCTIFTVTCRDFRVLPRLLAVTTDNASNNDTFLAHLETACREQDIPFGCESTHVRCIAHVINLAVQDFLGALNSAALDSDTAYTEAYTADGNTASSNTASSNTTDTNTAGFITRLRKLVIKVRSSPQRRKEFARACKDAKVSRKELIVDVRTRWNSTHAMIKRALELRRPLDITVATVPDLDKYKLTDREWQLLERVLPLFAAFKAATDLLCGDTYPTLATAVPVYNFLLDRLDDYRDACDDACEDVRAIRAATVAAIEKFKRYYAEAGAEVYAVATILDPRFKLQYYKDNEWEDEWIEEALERFRSAYACYRSPPASSADERAPAEWDDMDLLTSGFGRRRTAKPDELEAYLAAPVAGRDTKTLQWWKANAASYPCLAAMALDYLAIPATGAPVERVFSGGADLVRPKRGSLSENSVRECMCLKSWGKLAR